MGRNVLKELSFNEEGSLDLEFKFFLESEITGKTYYLDTYVIPLYEGKFSEFEGDDKTLDDVMMEVYQNHRRATFLKNNYLEGEFRIYVECQNAEDYGVSNKEAEELLNERGENSFLLKGFLINILEIFKRLGKRFLICDINYDIDSYDTATVTIFREYLGNL